MGRVTTHILDTAQGRPAKGVTIKLYDVDNSHRLVTTRVTNSDGRTDEPLLDSEDFKLGVWEIIFDVGSYFASTPLASASLPFLDQVPIRFAIGADEHYHVPLLATPWSYSTYRGS